MQAWRVSSTRHATLSWQPLLAKHQRTIWDGAVWLLGLGETTLEHTPERRHVYNRDTLHLRQTEQVLIRAYHIMHPSCQSTLEKCIIRRITALLDSNGRGNQLSAAP